MSAPMDDPILVPMLGENIKEAEVVRWHKKVGEWVKKGEPLAELETDKINVEIPAEHAGLLSQIAAAPGTKVRIGDCLAILSVQDAERIEMMPTKKPRGVLGWIISQVQAIRAGTRAGSEAYGPFGRAEKEAAEPDDAAKPDDRR